MRPDKIQLRVIARDIKAMDVCSSIGVIADLYGTGWEGDIFYSFQRRGIFGIWFTKSYPNKRGEPRDCFATVHAAEKAAADYLTQRVAEYNKRVKGEAVLSTISLDGIERNY